MKVNKISVIIPMYNSENTIKKCIESVLHQSYTDNVEIIIVNDGSRDNSKNIVEQIIDNNTSIINIHLINKENGGVSSARNLGMKAATGDWIALLDSDDEWLGNKLEVQVQILNKNPHIDFLAANRNGECFSRILWKKLEYLSRISARNLLGRFVFIVPTVIFKKEILSNVGYFDENQRFAEEGIFFIKIAHNYNCYLLNESLAFTGGGKPHFGHSGLSGNLKEMEKGELKNLKTVLKLKIINPFEYLILVMFSYSKYLRRIILVKLR
ncbi:glycosyltransferase family 2 protein [Flavobacterium sp. 2]|uniref:glycosyltransferase family 2 protein n=1 Tax=Flavobacterium sp. 2 TaxID=308053 RepID=UPI000C1A3C2D|nr:glycosyltransferase family 2 protein [Flavobacterium sp. 2]PIF59337.1 glycosyltransferase involved in cell wall biosynthesis [Flavobacterium sp. 2]